MKHALSLEALAPTPSRQLPPGTPLGRAQGYVAEFQHHDAVTGTHETNVTAMYQAHLDTALTDAETAALAALARLGGGSDLTLRPFIAEAASAVLVRNSLGWDLTNVLVTVAVPTGTMQTPAAGVIESFG